MLKLKKYFCDNCGKLLHASFTPMGYNDSFCCDEFSGRSVMYQVTVKCIKCDVETHDIILVTISHGTHDHDSDDIEELTDWQLDLS